MTQRVIYTLNSQGILGCVPECIIVKVDKDGEFQIDYTIITDKDKKYYENLLDEIDLVLLQCCSQLHIDKIRTLIPDKNIDSWESIKEKYFSPTKRLVSSRNNSVKEYLLDYVSRIQNKFFEHLSGKPFYFPQGRFSFTWQALKIEMDIPELFYCFDYANDSITYSLDIKCRNQPLKLEGGILVSRDRARVMLHNKIYEFEENIDGIKLFAFLSKENIVIPQKNVTSYFDNIIRPLVKSNRVIPKGFDIDIISEIDSAILEVRELGAATQMSLFEDSGETHAQSIIFDLVFKYGDFKYWASQQGFCSKFNKENYNITYIERDKNSENQFISTLKEIGIDINGQSLKMNYFDGVEWLNQNHKKIESAGIDIQFKRSTNESVRYFMGERNIKVEVKENNDWFDIYGTVFFGKYEIPFLQILNYIRHNKRMILLPNGEYAQIPQKWIDEYSSLIQLSEIENEGVIIRKHYAVLLNEFSKKPDFSVNMRENLRYLIEHSNDVDFDLPTLFNGTLRSYQKEGYNWLRLLDELNMGGCLADDMGLGKTIQTLCLIQYLKEQGRQTSLLIVPTSLVYNWQQEAAKFTPDLEVYVHVGNDRTKNCNDFANANIILTSYAILRRDKQLFSSMAFEYMILDEAQAIKNPRSAITQICLSIKSKHFLTLTGTPIENSLSDLWSQVHFFNRGMLGSERSFTKNCKIPEKQALYKQLLKPFLLRRNKSEVLTDLPEKTIIVQQCKMSEEQEQQYRDIRNSYRDKFIENVDSNKRVNAIVLLEGLLRLRQISNHPSMVDKDYSGSSGKYDMATQMMSDVINQGDKVLVFSSFVEHLKIYRHYLDMQDINYCYIDGSTKNRQEQVDLFQNSDDYQVFLLSLKAGGTGLNLTRASYVFLLDPWWNPASEAQAYDRAHRIGQKNDVFVYKFITQNTIEEKILKLQERKLSLSNAILENDASIVKQLDIDEVMKLLE